MARRRPSPPLRLSDPFLVVPTPAPNSGPANTRYPTEVRITDRAANSGTILYKYITYVPTRLNDDVACQHADDGPIALVFVVTITPYEQYV